VEKMVRLTEYALSHELPAVYLIDSAGARITDQVELFFPVAVVRAESSRIRCALSGKVSAGVLPVRSFSSGRRVHPGPFVTSCSWWKATRRCISASPRMAEVVIGEHVSLDEMGRGARMPRGPSAAAADNLCDFRRGCDRPGRGRSSRTCRRNWLLPAPVAPAVAPLRRPPGRSPTLSRSRSARAYDMHDVVDALVDDGSFFEIKPLWGAAS